MKKFVYLLFLLPFAFISCDDKGIGEDLELSIAEKASNMKGAITVVGQNNPLIDPAAVQEAVDNYDKVILSGVFDFGFDETEGGVDITRPDVNLQGPATILNGAKLKFFTGLGTLNYPLSIQAPGVQVRELKITSVNNGIIVHVEQNGKPVVVESNNIKANGDAISISSTSCGISVLDNNLEAMFGYYGYKTLGKANINDNFISGYIDGIRIFDFDHMVNIINNSFTASTWDAIWLGAWTVTEESGPEWGDNGPVKIIGNSIDLNDSFAAGIMIGASNRGINNVLVKNNTLTGMAGYGGLMKQPYGHNNSFINNDLTGLTTYSPQIWVTGGHDNHYNNNKLGPVEPFWASDWGSAIRDAATLISTINWHYKDNWANTPDPVNYANHFSQNDYSQTGVPGWSDDPESVGAVLLIDFLQRYDANFEPSDVPYDMENFVNEKIFPVGTDLCTQVLDLSNLEGDDLVKGTNQIAGWMTCEVQASKTTYKMVGKRYEHFGMSLKDKHMKRMEKRRVIE